ncbi:hypothetical protein [uncultured Roseivirga sp.]|uniref:hypothetical protein n=1 Tax=uncultured Roseivirga sp. TaxID=543088 RepID=UPI0030DC4A84
MKKTNNDKVKIDFDFKTVLLVQNNISFAFNINMKRNGRLGKVWCEDCAELNF